MGKVTSKLQVTVPKLIADAFGIRPGDEIGWVAAGDVIRVLPGRAKRQPATADRLKVFDQATERQRQRQRGRAAGKASRSRGWTREELYQRGRAR